MRRIFKYPLPNMSVTVDMPEGAEIVRLGVQGPRSTPTVWALVDDDNPTEPRRFLVVGTGHPLPRGARYVGSSDSAPFVWHVVELFGEPLPDGLDLPADAEAAYRTLTGAGFKLRDDKAWIAPDDEPLTTEQMVAVATLHEHGFGSVVSA